MVFGCKPLSLKFFRCASVNDEFLLACRHERLQNHPLIHKDVFVKINSCGQDLRILRVAASPNNAKKARATAPAQTGN